MKFILKLLNVTKSVGYMEVITPSVIAEAQSTVLEMPGYEDIEDDVSQQVYRRR